MEGQVKQQHFSNTLLEQAHLDISGPTMIKQDRARFSAGDTVFGESINKFIASRSIKG